mmetsp:Transcript_34413/g.86973  ORF Transcript_34413/g.86973 Transcript_34413/m.86973 type:complete len:267 (-) Transcript_34413:217-1017(-)
MQPLPVPRPQVPPPARELRARPHGDDALAQDVPPHELRIGLDEGGEGEAFDLHRDRDALHEARAGERLRVLDDPHRPRVRHKVLIRQKKVLLGRVRYKRHVLAHKLTPVDDLLQLVERKCVLQARVDPPLGHGVVAHQHGRQQQHKQHQLREQPPPPHPELRLELQARAQVLPVEAVRAQYVRAREELHAQGRVVPPHRDVVSGGDPGAEHAVLDAAQELRRLEGPQVLIFLDPAGRVALDAAIVALLTDGVVPVPLLEPLRLVTG